MLWTGTVTRTYDGTQRTRLPSQPETEPYKGVLLMGDKGGKKDKKKAQDQKNEKLKIKDKKKKDKDKDPKRII